MASTLTARPPLPIPPHTAPPSYRLKAFVDSRRYLNALLEKFPESAQARNLMVDVEDAIIRDGLLTAGVATGAVVVGGLILGALLGGKRR